MFIHFKTQCNEIQQKPLNTSLHLTMKTLNGTPNKPTSCQSFILKKLFQQTIVLLSGFFVYKNLQNS